MIFWNSGGNIAVDTSGVGDYSDFYCNEQGYSYTRLDSGANWRFYFRAVANLMQKTAVSQVYSSPGVYNISVKYDGSYVNCYQEVNIIERNYKLIWFRLLI